MFEELRQDHRAFADVIAFVPLAQVAFAGLVLGLLISLKSAGLMKSLLFGLEPRDPGTFAIAFVVVILVSLSASLLPARRAASIAPVQALRTE